LHGLVRERPPACLGDLYVRDLDRTSAGDHALGLCGRMSDAYHRARKLLEANKEQAIKVAEYLIEHGKIDGVAVERLFPV